MIPPVGYVCKIPHKILELLHPRFRTNSPYLLVFLPMQLTKRFVGITVGVVFALGAAYIVYAGRPVMNRPTALSATPVSAAGMPPTRLGTDSSYTMADIQAHSTQSSCWSAIGGDVYDLTSWISRHPGGEGTIIGLCGTDGTAAYTNQHKSSRRPKSVLALLKIGILK